jgi:hypothetical protein
MRLEGNHDFSVHKIDREDGTENLSKIKKLQH